MTQRDPATPCCDSGLNGAQCRKSGKQPGHPTGMQLDGFPLSRCANLNSDLLNFW